MCTAIVGGRICFVGACDACFRKNICQATAAKALALKGNNKAESETKKLPDDGEIAGSFCFGEATVQLHLTRGIVRALTNDTMSLIWKVLLLSYSSSHAAIYAILGQNWCIESSTDGIINTTFTEQHLNVCK